MQDREGRFSAKLKEYYRVNDTEIKAQLMVGGNTLRKKKKEICAADMWAVKFTYLGSCCSQGLSKNDWTVIKENKKEAEMRR